MRQLQDLRDQLQEAEHRLAVDTVNSRPWSSPGPTAQINSFAEVLAPSEVVVSRHRRFSGRLFRLWVEETRSKSIQQVVIPGDAPNEMGSLSLMP
eukprot:symbB.v1.2.026434.t1/scaffold2641.1/size74269/2